MNANTFDYIWINIVEKNILELYNKYSIFTQYDLKYSNLNNYKILLKKQYEASKNKIKRGFFNVGTDGNRKMDIHKIGACFCDAILSAPCFKFKYDENIPDELLLINYSFAYYVSIGIIYISLIDFYSTNDNKIDLKKLLDHHTVFVPITNTGHDPYNLGRIKTLALNDMYGIQFDILTYSDMLYWIEKYNKDYISILK